MSEFTVSPSMPRIPEVRLPDPAADLQKQIVKYARRFSKGCHSDGESAVIIASDGLRSFQLFRIGALDRQTMMVMGETDERQHIEMLVHHTALRVSMIAVPRSDEVVARRIGFNDRYLDDAATEEVLPT